MIQVFQPSLGARELAAVREVFESNWLGRGARTADFEARFAEYQQASAGSMIGITSASEGLFIAAEVLGWSAGDEVVMPSISFVAAASAVSRVGARPTFCDVNQATLNATVSDIERVLTPRTKAVIVNHYGGLPADMEVIAALCRARNITIIEDAACAVGSRLNNRAAGTFGDIGVWSFDAMKVLVTADGGMLYAADDTLARALRQATYLGLPVETGTGMSKSRFGGRWWEFEIESFGRRIAMNDVTAAIGLVQLDRIQDLLRRRAEVAARYDAGLSAVPGLRTPPPTPAGVDHTHYLYWIQLERRDELARHLLEHDIYSTFRYWPLHRVNRFAHSGPALPASDRAAATTLNLPCHQDVSDADVDRIVDLIGAFLSR